MSLTDQLNTLERANLIGPAVVQPELEYLFRHNLIQEAAYGSILRADRRAVHRLAGECLEWLHPEQRSAPDMMQQLARHFEEAGEPARAQRYYQAAGEAAMARYANAEAVTLLGQALACAQRLPAEAVAEDMLSQLYTTLGRALEINGQYPEALANYEAMAQQAQARGERPLALAALVLQGKLRATANPLFDPAQAEQLAQAALAEARALGDRAAEAKILWNQINMYRFTLRNSQARECGEQSLALARELGLREQAALALNDLIHVYSNLGRWDLGRAASAEARHLWRELGNLPMLADSLSTTAIHATFYGEMEASVSFGRESYALSVASANLWGQSYSLSSVALAYWYQGAVDQAIAAIEGCLALSAESSYLVPQIINRAQYSQILLTLGDDEGALEQARLAVEWAERILPALRPVAMAALMLVTVRTEGGEAAADLVAGIEAPTPDGMIWAVDPILSAWGAVALAQGDLEQALALSDERVQRLWQGELLLYLPEALAERAGLALRRGQVEAARQMLNEARACAETIGARMPLWSILFALGQLEAGQGRPGEAEQAWQATRVIAREIAEHIAAPGLRQTFLARPDVATLMTL